MTREQPLIEIIRSAPEGRAWQDMRLLIASLRPFEIANLITASPPRARELIWGMVEEEDAPLVLQNLGEDVRAEILETMDPARLAAVTDSLDTDDLADILQQLPHTIAEQVLSSMDALDRERVEAVLSYPEDSAGGLMNTDTITVRPRHSIEVVVAILNGVLWATLVAGGTAIIFDDVKLGGLIATGLIVNMLVAAVFGSVLPILLSALRIDPAIAGGVVLTTITDVAGFFVFLGLATLVYL